uniref:Cyclin C-terminal domain-containing protein n=1 Tax=Kalanchoe fedtschenkoi TaxID=63787 RepID=A0A7N0VCB9_KALFE
MDTDCRHTLRLPRALHQGLIADKEMEQMAHFLSELAMVHYGVAVMFCPSLIATSAVYAARCTLVKTPTWDATLQFYTGISEAQLLGCAKLLVSFHSTAANADNKLKVVYRRYSNLETAAVALLSPAKSLTFAPNTC